MNERIKRLSREEYLAVMSGKMRDVTVEVLYNGIL